MRAGRRTIEVSEPDKILFPEAGLTKADLVEYYRRVSRDMLPHLRRRALVMQRFPDGLAREGRYQVEAPDWLPRWIDRQEVGEGSDTLNLVVCGKAATLVYLAQQAMVTPHIWLSRVDRPGCPDRLAFDLDPPEEGHFDAVRDAAERLRVVLEGLHLAPFPMTTGSRGVHIVVPLTGRESFEEVHRFARDVARMAVESAPERLTTEPGGRADGGRVVIDTSRNAYARTMPAPYALRARPEGPVATPFSWSELSRIGPRDYTTVNIFQRLGRIDDPWRDMKRLARSLGRARKPF